MFFQRPLYHVQKLPRGRNFTISRFTSSVENAKEICSNLGSRSSTDLWMQGSKKFVGIYTATDLEGKTKILTFLGKNYGVDSEAIDNAISLYGKNRSMVHELRSASTPLFHHLFQSIGNTPGGVRTVCDLRETILSLIKSGTLEKSEIHVLRRLEDSTRELLTTWFCLSNLKLQRLTWQSPGDILQKVAEYEAVHPVSGLVDIRRRVGPHRRCFYFTHEALPREPLVIVHVALTNEIVDNIQNIVKHDRLDSCEEVDNTAMYYSITSTQKGLSGIDLGNLLIKSVVAELQKEEPHIQIHSTLSPVPGFRAWVLRSLKGNSEFGCVVDEYCIDRVGKLLRKSVSREEVNKIMTDVIGNDRSTFTHLEPFKDVLMHLCAQYLYSAKRNGFALNPVANFHLRNGAQLYRINWMGDTSVRGMKNSLGIMVNYRYKIQHVSDNSNRYIRDQTIVIHKQVSDLL